MGLPLHGRGQSGRLPGPLAPASDHAEGKNFAARLSDAQGDLVRVGRAVAYSGLALELVHASCRAALGTVGNNYCGPRASRVVRRLRNHRWLVLPRACSTSKRVARHGIANLS